jgi:PPOX class probable F420-dependent enzyme
MTPQECQEFLAGLHVGIVSVAEPGRGPLSVPVWYAYEPGGEVWFITARNSRKAKLIERAGRASLCAQDENPPYKYVSIEGPVAGFREADDELHVRVMARRYYGTAGGDRYTAEVLSDPNRPEEVVIRLHPERWFSADYSKPG